MYKILVRPFEYYSYITIINYYHYMTTMPQNSGAELPIASVGLALDAIAYRPSLAGHDK